MPFLFQDTRVLGQLKAGSCEGYIDGRSGVTAYFRRRTKRRIELHTVLLYRTNTYVVMSRYVLIQAF
jgi:hypothetical protein